MFFERCAYKRIGNYRKSIFSLRYLRVHVTRFTVRLGYNVYDTVFIRFIVRNAQPRKILHSVKRLNENVRIFFFFSFTEFINKLNRLFRRKSQYTHTAQYMYTRIIRYWRDGE